MTSSAPRPATRNLLIRAVLALALVVLGLGVGPRAEDVTLQPGTIQGTVTLGTETIGALTVYAWCCSPSQSANGSWQSNAYTLTVNVPSGTTPTYSVQPRISTDQGYDWLQAPASTVQVAANPAVSTLDFSFTPAYIEGHVALPANSSISIYAYANGWNAGTWTSPARNGDFRFPVLAGTNVQMYAYYSPAGGGSLYIPVTTFTSILEGETKVQNVTLPATGGSISGVLTVNGPRTPSVAYMIAAGNQYKSVQVGAGGAYALTGLANGPYSPQANLYFNAYETYLRPPYGSAATSFPPVTIADNAVSLDPVVDEAFITGTVALTGTKTLAAATSAVVYASGQHNTATQSGWEYDRATLAGGEYELVVTPGSWYMSAGSSFAFSVNTPDEFINSYLNVYDYSQPPVVASASAPVTHNLTYATGTVTIVLRTLSGTFSFPRLQGSCNDSGLLYSYINANGRDPWNQVAEAPVTFVGVMGRCTITAYGRPAGAAGETTFGTLAIDVVPGSDQTVDIGGPTLTVQSPAANAGFTSGPITVSGKATDDQEVSTVTVNGTEVTLTPTNNPADPKEVSFSFSLALSPGANAITTIATDSSGKATKDERTVYLDGEDPAVSWTPADGASFPVGQVVVSGTATDNVGVASVAIDGAVVYSASGSPQTSVNFTKALALAAGTYEIEVSVQDLGGRTVVDTHTITVGSDTTPPVLSLPANISVEATGPSGAAVSYSASASDDKDGAVAVTCSPASGGTFPLGETTVSCSAADAAGNTASGSFTVTVVDTTAPVISSVSPSLALLWPPNHQLVPVSLSVDASDSVSAPVCRITGVTSSEPDDGLGDGDTSGDIQGVSGLSVQLRAERSGGGDGRTYTIAVECVDAAGNSATGTTAVGVPKSKGR